MDPEAIRLAKQTRAIVFPFALLTVLAAPVPMVNVPLVCWMQADARVRGHALATGEAWSIGAVPPIGLPIYLWRTRRGPGLAVGAALIVWWCGCAGVLSLLFGR
jgi:hypothetical protein